MLDKDLITNSEQLESNVEDTTEEELSPAQWRARASRIPADIKESAKQMGRREARYLVNTYYLIQENRKRADSQNSELAKRKETIELVDWLASYSHNQEDHLKALLLGYASVHPETQWAMSIRGISGILASGLLAHIDIERAQTVGSIWRYAGLDPTSVWGKGEVRPWNAKLKVHCWKIGQSFAMVKNHPDDIYGKVMQARKDYETDLNEKLVYADQAVKRLEDNTISKDTDAYIWYSMGMLPPQQLQTRAERYAVKLFLSHYHHVAYEIRFGTPPPKPYILNQEGHTHFVKPPNWD